MTIKIIITLFALFAISRAYLRYRDGSIKFFGFIVWTIIWAAVTFFAWWPKFSDLIANSIGVGRGVDALVYLSIVALFYGMFRIYVKIQFIEHEITSLVRNIALKEQDNKNTNETKEESPHSK